MRQVGYLQGLYRDAARSTEHKILELRIVIRTYNGLNLLETTTSPGVILIGNFNTPGVILTGNAVSPWTASIYIAN